MNVLKNFLNKFKKEIPPQPETNNYRCPECGKFTEITTPVEYKQLYECAHCGRMLVICHGRTIGYK